MATTYQTYVFLKQIWDAAWKLDDGDVGGLRNNVDTDALFVGLMRHYDHGDRHYHTTTHLREALGRFYILYDDAQWVPTSAMGEVPVNANVVTFALFYHDVVVNPAVFDGADVLYSARQFEMATDGCFDPKFVERVKASILATDYNAVMVGALSPEAHLVRDLDIAIFAQDPERGRTRMFEYEGEIFREFLELETRMGHPVPRMNVYYGTRMPIIERLYGRAVSDSLFTFIKDKLAWNHNARRNLAYLLGVLDANCRLCR